MRARWLPCLFALASSAAPAGAEPGVRAVVVQPPTAFHPAATESPFVYLNRCRGGCTVTGGNMNDARQQESSIPKPGTYTIQEFTNFMGSVGVNGNCDQGSKLGMPCTADATCMGDTCNTAAGTCTGNAAVPCTSDADCNGTCDTADRDWAAIVQCMQEVYSPYAVTLTDTQPADGTAYTEALIAGQPTDIGEAPDVLGIAPIASDCSAQNDVISFTFANHHPDIAQARVLEICWTAAQETAHAFGLDHEFSFVSAYPSNGNSTCMDPMTYRVDCGGEKFFRNADAKCGEQTTRQCRCGGTQNSHAKLLSVFGAGQSTVPAPTVSLVTMPSPRQGAAFPVFATAGSRRGVARVELWLNGYPWASTPGGVFGTNGQVDPSNYTLTAPASVPDGVIDVVVKAYDDLGIEGETAKVTVQKGAPCTSSGQCATGQKCDASGRCYWDPPSGKLGDSCPYPQFCTSGTCSPADQGPVICTQACSVGSANACPSGYDCVPGSGGGFCYPTSDAGCCSAAGDRGPMWPHAALAALVLGLVGRRRARRDKSC